MRLALLAIVFSSSLFATPVSTLDIYAVYSGISTVPSFLAIPVGTEPAQMPVTWPGASGPVGDLDAVEESLLTANLLCSQSPGCSNTIANPVLTGPTYDYEFDTGVTPSTFWFSAATGAVTTPTWLTPTELSTLENAGLIPLSTAAEPTSDPPGAAPEPSTFAGCFIGLAVLIWLARSKHGRRLAPAPHSSGSIPTV